jgi:hypothetical protein
MRYTISLVTNRLGLAIEQFYVHQDGAAMTAEASSNPITKIGRYRIAGELERGGMGIVYQGEDRLIGRRVHQDLDGSHARIGGALLP